MDNFLNIRSFLSVIILIAAGWLFFLCPKTNNHESHQLVLNRDSQLFLGFVAYLINILSKSKDLQVQRDLVLIFD